MEHIFDGQNILCSSSPITAQEDYFDDVDVVAYFPVMVRKINVIKLQVHSWQKNQFLQRSVSRYIHQLIGVEWRIYVPLK